MSAITVGRVCVKTAGKDAAKYCVITEILDESNVMITGPKDLNGIKLKKCNILHIDPTSDVLKIKAKADDAEVIKAIDTAKLTDKIKAGIKL